jgi:uncharacterized membrane protein
MTTIIDHAISIPVPPAAVWKLLSNLEAISRWQTDCKKVVFLTTGRRGAGTRIRCSGAGDKAYVLEVTTWYEGLGYEYRLVDGVSYSDNKGRLRLQEIAEGTVVQWTFSYEMGGVLGGLRNSMGLKRTVENQMIESLRQLYRVTREASEDVDVEKVKSLMRDGPSVEQRAQYQPRHPSRYEENRQRERTASVMRPPTSPRRPIIEEPLPKEDDTRPNPIVMPTGREPAPTPTLEELLKPVRREPPSIVNDTPAATLPSRFSDVSFTPTPPVSFAPPIAKPEPPVPPIMPPLAKPELPAAKTEPNLQPEKPPLIPAAHTTTSVNPVVDVDKLDTGKISVFEIFGLQKPSETQQLKAVNLTVDEVRDTQLSAPTELHMPRVEIKPTAIDTLEARQEFMVGMSTSGDIEPPEFAGRSGLRLKQRRNLLALRRPKKQQ